MIKLLAHLVPGKALFLACSLLPTHVAFPQFLHEERGRERGEGEKGRDGGRYKKQKQVHQ